MMAQQTTPSGPEMALPSALATISRHRFWFIILGVLLIVLGAAAIVFPFATTVAAKTVFGWLFILGGIGQIVHAFSTQKRSQFVLDLLIGVLYLIVGGWLAFFPLTGILTLTVILAATFVVHGGIETVMAFRIRPHEGWGWMLLSGILAIAAGLLILAKLPSSAVWAIGLLVGVNLISSGWAYLILAMAVRKRA